MKNKGGRKSSRNKTCSFVFSVNILQKYNIQKTKQKDIRKHWEVLYMSMTLIVAMVSQVFAGIQTHQTVHIKYVQCFVYQLYFNKAIKTITYAERHTELNCPA